MEFKAHTDIEAPIEFVFDQVTDFSSFERSIMRRGGDVEQLHGSDGAVLGTTWQVKFRMRGKQRTVRAELVRVDAPNGLTVDVTSPSVDGTMIVELVALSRARTRINLTVDASAKTIPAKLMFQSIRFARTKTQKRFTGLVSGFAKEVESRYRA